MNTSAIAAALNTLSLGIAELAEALSDSPVPVSAGAGREASGSPAATPAPTPFEASPFVDVPEEVFAPQGSEAICPRHKREFRDSKFAGKPAYCTAKEDDPKWSRNGFCSINADNVQKWIREQVAA